MPNNSSKVTISTVVDNKIFRGIQEEQIAEARVLALEAEILLLIEEEERLEKARQFTWLDLLLFLILS